MTGQRPLLLLTRPDRSARRFLAQLDPELIGGVDVVISPLLTIVPAGKELELDGFAGLIFTSANGVAAAAEATVRRDQIAYCVGPATTHAAKTAGWEAVQTGRTAEDLVATLIGQAPRGPLLHLRGKHARGSVAKRLSQAGLQTAEQVVYNQVVQPLSEAAIKAMRIDRAIIVPLFSPRSAKLFAEQAPSQPMAIAALSDAVAQNLGQIEPSVVHIAQSPDAKAMGQLVEKLMRTVLSG